MNRLTFTKEFKKHEEIGHILCLKPEKLIEWEEKLSQYEDIGEPKELIKRPSLDENGLVPCGCGGEVYPHYQLGWYHEESGVQAFEVSTGCDGCGTYTKPRCGHYVNGIDEDDTESASKRDWNISHGYTDPPQGAHTANWQTETEGR